MIVSIRGNMSPASEETQKISVTFSPVSKKTTILYNTDIPTLGVTIAMLQEIYKKALDKLPNQILRNEILEAVERDARNAKYSSKMSQP